jgi:hypothetical protein
MGKLTHAKYLVIIVFFIFLVSTGCSTSVENKNVEKESGLSFVRISEPGEGAFTILVPRGWKSEGGIFRVNAVQAGGPINAMEAKCDLTFKSDRRGTVSFRILPDIVYAHVGIGGGFFRPGSNYQGAEVRQIVNAPTHLKSIFFTLHPQATSAKTLKITRLPGEKQAIDKGLAYLNRLLTQLGGQPDDLSKRCCRCGV